MIVHFIGSTKNLENDLPYLKAIIEVLHDRGAVLARDWLGAAVNNPDKSSSYFNDSKVDWTEVHREDLAALSRSDIVIIEATTYSFQNGFFASQAINNKKPTLIIARFDSKSHPLFGIKDKLLTTKSYSNKEELRKIVDKFLKANTIATKDLRFNFFIDRQIYSYLREVSYESGKNKSEIIRELIESEIDKQDKQ
jgi:hypothetical protein